MQEKVRKDNSILEYYNNAENMFKKSRVFLNSRIF